MASIKTPEAILSYPNLFSPRSAAEGQEPMYSATFVVTADQDLTPFKKKVMAVAKEQWGDKLAGGKIKQADPDIDPGTYLVADAGFKIRLPWRDHPKDVAKKNYPEGSAFINARSKNPVGIVALFADPATGKPAVIINEQGDVRYSDGTVVPRARPVYAGVMAKALLSVYAYDRNGNRGVSVGLQGVQILGDGDPSAIGVDSMARAEDAFDADMDAAPDLSDLTGESEPEEEMSDLPF